MVETGQACASSRRTCRRSRTRPGGAWKEGRRRGRRPELQEDDADVGVDELWQLDGARASRGGSSRGKAGAALARQRCAETGGGGDRRGEGRGSVDVPAEEASTGSGVGTEDLRGGRGRAHRRPGVGDEVTAGERSGPAGSCAGGAAWPEEERPEKGEGGEEDGAELGTRRTRGSAPGSKGGDGHREGKRESSAESYGGVSTRRGEKEGVAIGGRTRGRGRKKVGVLGAKLPVLAAAIWEPGGSSPPARV